MSKAADLALLAGGADTSTVTSNTGSVTLTFSQFQNFILTFTGNVTLANPTTEVYRTVRIYNLYTRWHRQ